ncbi:MAG: acyl-CoA thioesterase [Ottowia sp.]|uniref:acyl-CoA thioesterase n=1 Tax=unclassified Ottowia TaxID=2645081 RepID=UPI003C2DA160
MMGDFERVVSREPLVIERRVRWAECDPAGVVYTGKFTEYLLSAMAHVLDTLAGEQRYFKWAEALGIDTPCKGLEMEFHSALWPDDVFRMHCSVAAIRQSSFDVLVQAYEIGTERHIFTGRFSPICISRQVRKRVDIPPQLLEALRRL